jgi:hypothetical protein
VFLHVKVDLLEKTSCENGFRSSGVLSIHLRISEHLGGAQIFWPIKKIFSHFPAQSGPKMGHILTNSCPPLHLSLIRVYLLPFGVQQHLSLSLKGWTITF